MASRITSHTYRGQSYEIHPMESGYKEMYNYRLNGDPGTSKHRAAETRAQAHSNAKATINQSLPKA